MGIKFEFNPHTLPSPSDTVVSACMSLTSVSRGWEVYACSILIEHRHQESVFLSPTRLLIRTASRRIKCRVRARTLSRCLVDEVIRVLVTKKHKIESSFANFGVFVTWTRVLTSSTHIKPQSTTRNYVQNSHSVPNFALLFRVCGLGFKWISTLTAGFRVFYCQLVSFFHTNNCCGLGECSRHYKPATVVRMKTDATLAYKKYYSQRVN